MKILFLFFLALTSLAAMAAPAKHVFKVDGDHFSLDGKPFVIRSGEMHYQRIPRQYWPDRLQKAKAMGLNTICTYVFWNVHEPTEGKFDFSGDHDVAAFIKEAQKQGLFVLVRPGPYVCSEWEWGGFPYWLANVPGIKIRQNEPQFLKYAARYLKQVGKQLAPFTVEHGGPILMCQVENEYGSFGHDHEYMAAIHDAIRAAGFGCQLYTSDGPGQDMLNGGTLPDCLSVVNFGGGPEGAFREFAKFRQGVPKMCGEFWAGWFDHWGDGHAVTDPVSQAQDLDWFLSNGVSFNIYMVHGGTSFGWMNGANSGGTGFEPDVTSYDYDSAISEDGRLTQKWRLFRDVIKKHLEPGETLPDPPLQTTRVGFAPVPLTSSAPLLAHLGKGTKSDQPIFFEKLDHPYGFVLYRTHLATAAEGALHITNLQDFALVMVNGAPVGTIDRRIKQNSLDVTVSANSTLDVLVENTGRINFSRALLGEHKGFVSATLGGTALTGWESIPVNTDRVPENDPNPTTDNVPRWFTGSFVLTERGDTFLDMSKWGKGNVWVNGHHLGRFWHIGAQRALYVPGVWVHEGWNDIRVLDLQPTGATTIGGVKDPIYEVDKPKQ
jgi:beta-galactosidase